MFEVIVAAAVFILVWVCIPRWLWLVCLLLVAYLADSYEEFHAQIECANNCLQD